MMTTTAAVYGCCSAALPPCAEFTESFSACRAPPPPRVSLVASSKLRATTPELRVSCPRRRLVVAACSSEVSSDAARRQRLDTALRRQHNLYFVNSEATVDIKLPRRSLLVQFTCNACGERTKRLINRVAYERGTVFLQCAGCQVYHKFVDNLGLVVEYNL